MIKRQSEWAGKHERVRRTRSMVQDRDEDLTLFQDMRNRELNSYLHPSKEDIEVSLTTKFGGISGYRAMAPLTPRKGANDLLASEAEKNDYDWLLTPPGTPLFPLLDQENSSVRQPDRDFSICSAAFTRSFMHPHLQEHSSSVVSRRISGLRHSGSDATASFGTGRMRVQSTSAPAVANLSPSSRSSTPTRRSVSPNRGKSSAGSVRSKTPTSRPSTPPVRTSNPPSRASTPTARSKTPNSRSLTPSMRRSLSCPVGSRDTSSNPSPRTRRISPSRKSTASSLAVLGLSLQPPPNLRTTMPEPSMSTRHGVSARSRANNLVLQAQNFDAMDLNICQQHPGSPHLSISSSSASHETEVFSSHSSRDSVISPHQEGKKSLKLGTNPRKSRIIRFDQSNSTGTLHGSKFAKTSVGRPAFSSSRGNSIKSTEATSCYKETRPNTSRGFRPLMTSNFNTTFYTKSSNLEDHPSNSLFEDSVNNCSNASSQFGGTVAPWSGYGEASLQRDCSGNLKGSLTCSFEQVTDCSARVMKRHEDVSSVVDSLKTERAGNVLPEDVNVDDSDSARNLSFNAGFQRNNDLVRDPYNTELENGSNKESMQKCNVRLNLSATSSRKDPTLYKDVNQNLDHVKVDASQLESTDFPFVTSLTGAERTCAEMRNVGHLGAVDVVRQGALLPALVLESDIPNDFAVSSENQLTRSQFEDEMDIDYSDHRLGHEWREECLAEKDVHYVSTIPVSMKPTHVQCQSPLLDPNCSNSSMEIYQFNERLELSSVETAMSSASKYAENPFLPPKSGVDYHRLEDTDSDGANSHFSATRLLIPPEAIPGKGVCRKIFNDKLHLITADGKTFLPAETYKSSPSNSCSSHPFIESMTWPVQCEHDQSQLAIPLVQIADDYSDYQESLWKSHKLTVNTSKPTEDPTDSVLSGPSVERNDLDQEMDDLQRCACPLHVEAGITTEEITISHAGHLEILEYNHETYAEMEGRMCGDICNDALAQQNCCMSESEVVLKWSPKSIAVKEVTAVFMEEHDDSPLSSQGASDHMPEVVPLLRQDEVDKLSQNWWKEDVLLEEEQIPGVEVCAMDVLGVVCSSGSLSSKSDFHEPLEDTLIELVQPQAFETTNETSQFLGQDSYNEISFPLVTEEDTANAELAIMCTSILHDLVAKVVALALEKEESATSAIPSTKELVTLLGPSETKRKIQNPSDNTQPGILNEQHVGAGSTVSRRFTYMQNQKVMQSATVGYLQSPVGKVREDMKEEDDSMLAAFEIDEKDDAPTRTKQKCCCTIM